ncbi:MAG: hypothetical protein BWY75_02704 [bacterium ADurb.Bin425]|nr:MAG: hypothetical protein BWY75_02704 [bacterium ADurb.Bin425]
MIGTAHNQAPFQYVLGDGKSLSHIASFNHIFTIDKCTGGDGIIDIQKRLKLFYIKFDKLLCLLD